MTGVLRPQSADQRQLQITIDELEHLYSASKTCFDPKHNLFWANFTKAINNYFAEAYARAAAPRTLESLTPADYVLAAQKVLTYLIVNVHIPHVGMALENEVGRIIYRSLEEQPQRAAAPLPR